jgi:hypothetical protein
MVFRSLRASPAHQRESFWVKPLVGASSVVCPCIAVMGLGPAACDRVDETTGGAAHDERRGDGVPQCRGGLAPTASLSGSGSGSYARLLVSRSVSGHDRVPGPAGGDDGVQMTKDGGGDRGLRLGRGELVLLASGQVPVAGAVDRVAATGIPTATSKTSVRQAPISARRYMTIPSRLPVPGHSRSATLRRLMKTSVWLAANERTSELSSQAPLRHCLLDLETNEALMLTGRGCISQHCVENSSAGMASSGEWSAAAGGALHRRSVEGRSDDPGPNRAKARHFRSSTRRTQHVISTAIPARRRPSRPHRGPRRRAHRIPRPRRRTVPPTRATSP